VPRARSTETMEKDARALDLHYRGLGYRQIAEQMGWKSPAAAHQAIRRAIADTYSLSRAEAVRVHEERLAALERAFNRVLATKHYVTGSSGNVALHPETGAPLVDDGPVIQAGMALLRVSESGRKMLGLDEPRKIEVRNVDALDARLIELADQMGPVAPRNAPGVPRQA
jgi:hypothetical protein